MFHVADVLTNNSRFMSDVIYSCARTEVTDVQIMYEVDLHCLVGFKVGVKCFFLH